MSGRRTTLLLVRPGHSTLSLEVGDGWPLALIGLLALPMLMGATARRCLEHGQLQGGVLAVSRVAAAWPASPPPHRHAPLSDVDEPRARVSFAATAPSAAIDPALQTDVVSAQAIMRAFPRARPARAHPVAGPGGEWLRVQALHLGEYLRVRPFAADGTADPQAFEALRHLMRCRITGQEVAIDPRLVRILVRISATYDRPIQLVSGHRTPFVIGTHPTSQHALGKAADIRVAGVSIEQLRTLALELGARGVGLYPEKGFVHVDVRDKPRYTWIYTEATGEQQDLR